MGGQEEVVWAGCQFSPLLWLGRAMDWRHLVKKGLVSVGEKIAEEGQAQEGKDRGGNTWKAFQLIMFLIMSNFMSGELWLFLIVTC